MIACPFVTAHTGSRPRGPILKAMDQSLLTRMASALTTAWAGLRIGQYVDVLERIAFDHDQTETPPSAPGARRKGRLFSRPAIVL